MLELEDFFIELSNESRLSILFLLYTEKSNMTQISLKLFLSLPEISRHLSRLREKRFIRKDFNGYYHLSNFGLATLSLLPGFVFITKNKDYILTHSFISLPPELFCRIGELKDSVRIKRFMNVVELIGSCLQKAEKKIFMMGDQILMSNAQLIEEKIKFGVKFSSLFPDNYIIPIKYGQKISNCINNRTCREIKNFILLTEKETVIAFADKSNVIDYSDTFYGKDRSSLKWSEDLVAYFFKLSEPSTLQYAF